MGPRVVREFGDCPPRCGHPRLRLLEHRVGGGEDEVDLAGSVGVRGQHPGQQLDRLGAAIERDVFACLRDLVVGVEAHSSFSRFM